MVQFSSYAVGETAQNGKGLTGDFVAVLQLVQPIFGPPTDPIPEFKTHVLATEEELSVLEKFAASAAGDKADLPLLQNALRELRDVKKRAAFADAHPA